MTKGDDTRKRIIDAAAELAAVRGLAAVSLNDVAEAVGLSKSGVFKHFQSKEALQQALVESVNDAFDQKVWRPVVDLPRGEPRLRAIVDLWLDWADGEDRPGGCGLTALAVELDDQPGPLRDFLRGRQLLWHKTLRSEFNQVGDPPLGREEADQAAFELKSAILGYHHQKRLLEDARARDMVVRAFERLLPQRAA